MYPGLKISEFTLSVCPTSLVIGWRSFVENIVQLPDQLATPYNSSRGAIEPFEQPLSSAICDEVNSKDEWEERYEDHSLFLSTLLTINSLCFDNERR